MENKITVIEPDKEPSWSQGDFCQNEFGVYLVSKDQGRLFTVRLQDGMCSWDIPKDAVHLPNKTILQVKIN